MQRFWIDVKLSLIDIGFSISRFLKWLLTPFKTFVGGVLFFNALVWGTLLLCGMRDPWVGVRDLPIRQLNWHDYVFIGIFVLVNIVALVILENPKGGKNGTQH